MNWMLALPEIVLACSGMAILVFGVLRKQDKAELAAHGGTSFAKDRKSVV